MQRLFLLCFIVLFSIVSNAQDLNRKIDSLIQAEFKEINGPGGVFLIAKKGKPIYKKAFGMANLELDSKLNTNSVFQIGSMTKQFTAIAI